VGCVLCTIGVFTDGGLDGLLMIIMGVLKAEIIMCTSWEPLMVKGTGYHNANTPILRCGGSLRNFGPT
jgi:hypothetical protein